MLTSIARIGAITLVAGLAAGTVQAADSYVVGISAAVTGQGSDTYAPVVEAIKLYIADVNARGGVNGKKIEILLEDDQAQPSKAAANVKQFLSRDDVLMVMNASLSSTYAPMIAETAKAGVPLFFAGAVCPKETYPKADPLLFCSTAFGAQYDSRFALDFIKETATEPVKLALVAMAVPVARAEIDFAENRAREMGLPPMLKEAVPPPTPDYSPFAAKIKESGANWVYTWSPWVTQVRTLEALRKLGWTGKVVAYAHINAEDELARLKDDNFYVFGTNAFFSEQQEIHRRIAAAAKHAGTSYPVTQLAEGWVAAMTLEGALKQTGWPASREKVAKAMSSLKVGMGGLRGGDLEWTADNHFRTKTYYRVYRWNSAKNAVERVKDWTGIEVK